MKYSINLLWLNKQATNHKYIYPGLTDEGLHNDYLYSAILWAKANPKATVNIWYDSTLYTDIRNSERNTESVLNQHSLSNVFLKDIRKIKTVDENQWVFDNEMPLYFRIDLLKMVILYHEFLDDKIDYAIYSDLQVGDYNGEVGQKKRMSETELFRDEWVEKMNSVAILKNGEENQFILAKKDPYSVTAFQHTINSCLHKIDFMISPDCAKPFHHKHLESLYNIVFSSTSSTLYQFYLGAKNDDIQIKDSFLTTPGEQTTALIKWDPKTHGYDCFGNYYNNNYFGSFFYINSSGDEGGSPTVTSTAQILKIPSYKDFVNSAILHHIKVDVKDGSSHRDTYGELENIYRKHLEFPVKLILDEHSWNEELFFEETPTPETTLVLRAQEEDEVDTAIAPSLHDMTLGDNRAAEQDEFSSDLTGISGEAASDY